jgi:SAM-dependent methyltransferase
MALATRLPWWAKIAAKLVLSRIPLPYEWWSRIGIFRHGDMADPQRALRAFRAHFERVQRAGSPLPKDFVMLELGPGDSVLSAGVARAYGAAASWLVDVGDFARCDPSLFRALDDTLSAEGLPTNNVPVGLRFEESLNWLNARYLTRGTASLDEIPVASVDFIWSSAVLEHVRRDEFRPLAQQLARILKPSGVMSHDVDLRDHLAGSLNNLRFSPRLWESRFWRNSGFYTNRLSQSEMLRMFADAGFKVVHLRNDLWPAPPLARAKLHASFRNRSDAELSIAGFEVVLVRS